MTSVRTHGIIVLSDSRGALSREGEYMKNLKIYNLAMYELLNQKEREEERLKARPNNKYTQRGLKAINSSIDYLHNLILIEESK